MTADDWISDLARLAEAATHGPWRADRWEDFTGREVTYSVSGDTEVSPTIHEHEDAEFIAAANPATILRLIAERDALAARLAVVEALADEWERFVATSLLAEDLRAALSAAPTDTTKETDR